MRKKGLLDGLLDVVAGLVCEIRSLELTSDREDSDWRFVKDGGAMPLKLGGVADDVRGDVGSSRGANDNRPFSSAMDFLGPPDGRVTVASLVSRGRSLERRNRAAARLIRDVFFLMPPKSPVGAVVMISGAENRRQQQLKDMEYCRVNLRRGSGGGFSACCLARSESWESEALRKRSTENLLCLLLSSCIGGVPGRAVADDARL
jgi:hypothetical protein